MIKQNQIISTCLYLKINYLLMNPMLCKICIFQFRNFTCAECCKKVQGNRVMYYEKTFEIVDKNILKQTVFSEDSGVLKEKKHTQLNKISYEII